MRIRIDNLPKVFNGYNFTKNKNDPIWSKEFSDWYIENGSEQIKAIHTLRSLIDGCDMYVLEFYNAEDATVFSLQFC